MSKSTPLSELQNSGNEPAISTKPLVQDILKEIQQEETVVNPQHASDPNLAELNQQQAVQNQPPPQHAEIPQQLDNTQLADNSDPAQYEQQQEQALQYQLDPNVNNPDNSQNVQDPSFQANIEQQMNTMGQMPDMGNMDMSLQNNMGVDTLPQKTLSQKIFLEARDPLLVMLISILLSVPIVNKHLYQLIAKIPGGTLTMVPICIKALVTALLFYTIRKLF